MEDFSSIKDLAQNSRYIVLATVNEDGTPHNSPLFYIPSEKLDKIFMGTHPQSLHARNITRSGEAFGVIFGRVPDGGRGIYLKINNFREVSDDELPNALHTHNNARSKIGKEPIQIEYYKKTSPQRMYVGDIVEISVNDAVRDDQGRLIQDVRKLIDASQLLT